MKKIKRFGFCVNSVNKQTFIDSYLCTFDVRNSWVTF